MAEAKTESVNVETPKKEEGPVPTEPETKPEVKTPEEDPEWQARVDKIAQSREDRVRTQYSKQVKDLQKEIELLKKEKMSEGEKREYEAQQLKEALESKEKDLTRREMELLAIKALDEKKLPASFIEFVIGGNEEETTKRIEALEKTYREAVKVEVDTRMKAHGIVPGKGRGTDTTSFEGMSPAEIQKKAREDPAWWDKNEKAITDFYKKGYK
jgi:vacuolar-type H+-ATPase subunit I/STV1